MIPIGRGDVVAISDAMPSDEKRVAQSSRAAHTIRIPRASLVGALIEHRWNSPRKSRCWMKVA